MDILGENYVKLIGKITYKKFKEFEGGAHFSCKLAVPIGTEHQYVKIAAWNPMAERLNELTNGSWIKVHGHIEESSYDTNCRYCKGVYKAYWTVVMIDNFIVLGGNYD